MILFRKAFIAFWSDIKITFFGLDLFLKKCHITKVPISYLVVMFVLVNRFLLRKNFLGITIWPFIILKEQRLKSNAIFLNHERIHYRQQIELLVLPFYIWYGLEFLVRLIQFKDRRKAYRNISFEREAYTHEKDLDYLKKRSLWKFTRFV